MSNVSVPRTSEEHAKIRKENNKVVTFICANCGKEIVAESGWQRKPRKFCCRKCTDEYYEKGFGGRKMYTANCLCCGKVMITKYKNRKYCSYTCAGKARAKA